LRDEVGPKALQLIIVFWERAKLMCKAGGYFGQVFQAKCGIIQVGPLSSTMFNLVVDTIVRAWLMEVDGTMDITDVRCLLACFHTDNRLIIAHDL
jgi:hypothetical protein